MPLTHKGATILHAMEREQGSTKGGKSEFYASINSGRVTGAEKARTRPSFKKRKEGK